MVEEQVRRVAWAIAEAWWRKHNRQAAGVVPEADSSTDYADRFWQGWVEEATAAIAALAEKPAEPEPGLGGLR
jgi:hypothetical protein